MAELNDILAGGTVPVVNIGGVAVENQVVVAGDLDPVKAAVASIEGNLPGSATVRVPIIFYGSGPIATNDPTIAELSAIFDQAGTDPFTAIVKDTSGPNKIFLIVYDGADYYHERLKKAV